MMLIDSLSICCHGNVGTLITVSLEEMLLVDSEVTYLNSEMAILSL